MHDVACETAHELKRHSAPICHRSELGVVRGGAPILICLLVATISVLVCQSSGFGAKPERSREKDNTNAAKTRIQAFEATVLLFTNKERRQAGLQPFEPSPALNYLARGQSKNMCDKRALLHESESFPRGWRTFPERLKIISVGSGGENVAYRTASPEVEKWAKQVVSGWMKSPPHKKNILTARYKYIGIGVAVCNDNLAYATQVFSPDAGRLP
jgi:uncharacterized protein YkwD